MGNKIFKFKGIVEAVEFQVITNSFALLIGIGYTPKYRELLIGFFIFGITIKFRK